MRWHLWPSFHCGNDDSHWWVIIMQTLHLPIHMHNLCITHVCGWNRSQAYKTTSNSWTAVPATCFWTITGNLKIELELCFWLLGCLPFFRKSRWNDFNNGYLPTNQNFWIFLTNSNNFQIPDCRSSFRVLRLPGQNCGNWLCLVLLVDVLLCGWIWNTELG